MKFLRIAFLASLFAFSAAEVQAAKPLQVWIMPNGVNPQGILEERLALFTKETGLKTQVVVLDWGEAWNRISTALESGKGLPDVMQLGTTWVSYFSARGELAKLDPWLPEINPSRYVPVSWSTTGVDGDTSVYSVPWFLDVRAILGNRRILAENDIKAGDIASYQDFYKALAKINAKNETLPDGTPVRAYAFPGKSDWNIPHNFAPWIFSAGGAFVKKDSNGKWQSNLLDPHTVTGIARYLRFVLDSTVDPSSLRSNTAQIAQRFNNGELAFILNTAEIVMQTRYKENLGGLAKARIGSDGVLVFPVPSGEAGSICFIGGSNLAIPQKKADNADARKLLLFLSRDDNLDAYTSKIGFLPPVKTVLSNWAKDSVYKVLVTQLETARPYPSIPNWGTVENTLVEMFSNIWSLVDVEGLYSEDAVYKTLVDYNGKINDILGAAAADSVTMSQQEFQAAWHAINGTDPDTADASSSSRETKDKGAAGFGLPTTAGILIAAIILGFIFAYTRKRKG